MQLICFYRIREWEGSPFYCDFLDLTIFKGLNLVHHRLDTKVHFKPTSLGIPLNHDSAHPKHCLSSWVFSEVRRYAQNTSGYVNFLRSRKTLELRLGKHLYPPEILLALRNYDPFIGTQLSPERRRERAIVAWLADPGDSTVTLVLPFERNFQNAGVATALKSLETQVPRGLHVTCRLAWKLHERPLFIRVRNAARPRGMLPSACL